MRSVELLIKPVSHACNLACGYCFYRRVEEMYPGKKRVMTPELLETLVVRFMALADGGPCVFSWQGGEPSLAGPEFLGRAIELQAKHGKPGQSVTNAFQTNATLLSPEWTAIFRRFNVLVGVSLDGPADRHDVYRRTGCGKGSHRQVMEAVRLLDRERVEFNILATIGTETAHAPADLYAWFLRKGFRYLQFIPATDRQLGRVAGFSITPEQYGSFLCGLFDAWWNGGRPLASVRFFDNILEALMGIPPSTCAMKETCGTYLVVEANGDVYPCDFFVMPEWKLGNIVEDEPAALYERAHARFGALKAQPGPPCADCLWRHLCRNGCLWHRWVPRGDLADTDYFCESYQAFFPHAMERLEFLQEAILRDRVAGSRDEARGRHSREKPGS